MDRDRKLIDPLQYCASQLRIRYLGPLLLLAVGKGPSLPPQQTTYHAHTHTLRCEKQRLNLHFLPRGARPSNFFDRLRRTCPCFQNPPLLVDQTRKQLDRHADISPVFQERRSHLKRHFFLLPNAPAPLPRPAQRGVPREVSRQHHRGTHGRQTSICIKTKQRVVSTAVRESILRFLEICCSGSGYVQSGDLFTVIRDATCRHVLHLQSVREEEKRGRPAGTRNRWTPR